MRLASYLLSSIFCLFAICATAADPTQAVTKKSADNSITGDLTFGTGKKLTIGAGGTLDATGATLIGITATSGLLNDGELTFFNTADAESNPGWTAFNTLTTSLASITASKYFGDGSPLTGIGTATPNAGAAAAYDGSNNLWTADILNFSVGNSTLDASGITGTRAWLLPDASGTLLLSNGNGSSLTGITPTQVGLGNVTNDAQTKASVMPNTAPASGRIPIGNGTGYVDKPISGSGATITLGSTGTLTISNIANASLANSAMTIAGTSTALGGAITQDTITGLSSTGLVKRTGANTLAIASSGTDYIAPSGALGTPSGGTLTNCTGLPPAGVTGTAAILGANTFTALQTITQASANAGVIASTGYSLTGSNATNMIDLAGTWNTTGTPTALKINVTNTASNAASLLMDLQVGGTSLFYAGSNGDFFARNGGISWRGIYLSDTSSNQLCGITGSNGFVANKDYYFGWTSATSINAHGTDTFLYRDSAAIIQMGADAATATNQGFKAHDGSGTDKAGANITLGGGQGTGTGTGGAVITKTSNTTTTGSTAQSYSTRSFQCPKFVDLTESSATLFCNIGVTSSKYAGAVLVATVTANDGTDFQCITSNINVNAINKAGTVTTTLTQVDGTTAASSGTLTATYTAVANGNGVDIKCNAVSSLTQTVLRVKWSVQMLNTDGADSTLTTGSLVTPQ